MSRIRTTRGLRGLFVLVLFLSLIGTYSPTQATPSLGLYMLDNRAGTYVDYQYGFGLQFPPSWQASLPINRYDQPDPIMIRRRVLLQPQDQPLTEIHVDIWENTRSLGLQQWFETYEQLYYTAAATITVAPQISIAGHPGLLAYEPAHASSHGRMTALAALNGAIVAVEYYTNDGGGYQHTFLDIVRSLSATNQATLQSATVPALPDVPLLGPTEVTVQVQSCCGWTDPNPNSYPCSGGNCTWWAKYKRPDLPNTWNDAWTWRNLARQAGFAVGYTARPDAIAVWQPNVAFGNGYRAGTVGHVAYVTSVNSNGTFVVTSMSWGDGCTKGDRGVSTFTARETGDENVTFIYGRNRAPNIPNQIAPANGSTVGGRAVTLQWQDTGDPDNAPRTYRDFYAEVWKSDNSWSSAMTWQVTTGWSFTVPSSGTYSWHVQSGDGIAGSGWSSTWSFNVPNQAPNIPSLSTPANGDTLGSRAVTLQWQDTGDPDNAPRTYRDFSGWIWNADNTWTQSLDWQTSASWSITVPADGSYYWKVQSGDGAVGSGWSSTWSFTVHSEPAAPSDLVQSDALPNMLAISWHDNSTNDDGFKIYKWVWDGTVWEFRYYASVGASVTRFVDDNLTCGSSYFYQVSAYNSAAESPRAGWIKASTADCPAPAAPSDPAIGGITTNSLGLSWQDNASDEDGFNIYKWGWNGGAWDFYYLAAAGANATSFADTGLQCATTYYYQVSAYNRYGESSRTSWVQGSTLECPLAEPTSLPTDPTHAPPTSTATGTPSLPPSPTATATASPVPIRSEKRVFMPIMDR